MNNLNSYGNLSVKGYCVSVYNTGNVIQSGVIPSKDKANEAVVAFKQQYPKACVHKRIIFSTNNTQLLGEN